MRELNADVEFPDGWQVRRPTLDDVPEILAMAQAACLAATGQPEFTDQEVREALTAGQADPARDSWLAIDPAGAVAGWAYLDGPDDDAEEFVEVFVRPDGGAPALAPLLQRQLLRVAERAVDLGHPRMTVRAGAVPTERDWISVLRAAGFAFVKRSARMRRALDDVSAEPPPPPPGMLIRPVNPDDEAELRLVHDILETAFRDAPDHSPTPYDRWRADLAALPNVAWDEWFLAHVDGVPAGALQSSDQQVDNGEGWVKRLAVLRAYRRRGVGGALLRRAFAAYAGKGRTHAGLGVDLSNPTEAVRLYRAVGMTAEYEADIFERSVEPGVAA
ncbi:GNAT family N-acetyltransferase [Plantactinospora sp. GCM10030261]|uniref:GNAT family N-acetyltransferase n=1 Tax=Plantactinospora sp. GCM10030261 TaxID=3273420 RepID=UPI003607CE52